METSLNKPTVSTGDQVLAYSLDHQNKFFHETTGTTSNIHLKRQNDLTSFTSPFTPSHENMKVFSSALLNMVVYNTTEAEAKNNRNHSLDFSSSYSIDEEFLQNSYSASSELLENFNQSNESLSFENGTPFFEDKFTFPLPFQVIIYVLYNAVFVAALLGNILVCYVVFSSPRMRTVTNFLIANLAVGDLLMALLCVPFSYISVLLQYWPFGEVLCHVVAPAQAVCVFVSAYTLVALAGDRYIAILYPLKPRLRRSQAIIVICIVWIVAFVTSSPIAVFTKMSYNDTGYPRCLEDWPDLNLRLGYGLTLMILQYFLPLAVLIFTYTRIALAVWGKKTPGEAEDGRDARLAKAKRKMIKMMLTVVIVYTVSWLPLNSIVVYGDLDKSVWEWEHMNYAFPIILWFALSHTVWNPAIYCYMNGRFRQGFRSAIVNVPFLRKWSILNQNRPEYPLQRINTYNTTYTFMGHGKMVASRNASMNSNGRVTTKCCSPSPYIRNFNTDLPHQRPHQQTPGINFTKGNRGSTRFVPASPSPGSSCYTSPTQNERLAGPGAYPNPKCNNNVNNESFQQQNDGRTTNNKTMIVGTSGTAAVLKGNNYKFGQSSKNESVTESFM